MRILQELFELVRRYKEDVKQLSNVRASQEKKVKRINKRS